MAIKAAVALAVCLGLRVVLAQGPIANEEVDANGFKYLVPHSFPGKTQIEAKKAANDLKNRISSMLFSPEPLGEGRGYFERYYTLVYFPQLTQTSVEALKALPDERQRFFRNHLEYCKSNDAHQVLVAVTLQEMNRIVSENFHPAVRYNAMLIISGLNDKEVQRVQPYAVPEPMVRALKVILDLYRACKGPEDDGIRLAALLGMSRHLEWEHYKNEGSPPAPIQPALRKEIMDELFKLAQTKDPPPGRDAEGHLWFRRRAVEALGHSCSKNADPAVASALEGLLRDEKEPLSLRLTVAATIGRVSLQNPVAVDAKALSTEMGYLALVALDTELSRVSNLRKTEEEHFIRLSGQVPLEGEQPGVINPRAYAPGSSPDGGPGLRGLGGVPGPGSGAYGRGPGMPGAMPGDYGDPSAVDPLSLDPKGYRFAPVRKRLRYDLYCVQIGLLGGEDHAPPKNASAPPPPMAPKAPMTPTTPAADKGPPPVPRGLFAVAKAGPDKTYVDDVYAKVRKLADLVENRSSDLFQMDRDLRREMKNLEAITRKLAPPAAPAAAAAAAAAEEADLLTPPVRGGAAPPMPMPPAAPAPGAAAAPAPMPKGAAPMPPAAAPMPPAAAPMPPAGPMPKGNTPAAPAPMPGAPAPPPMPAPAP